MENLTEHGLYGLEDQLIELGFVKEEFKDRDTVVTDEFDTPWFVDYKKQISDDPDTWLVISYTYNSEDGTEWKLVEIGSALEVEDNHMELKHVNDLERVKFFYEAMTDRKLWSEQ